MSAGREIKKGADIVKFYADTNCDHGILLFLHLLYSWIQYYNCDACLLIFFCDCYDNSYFTNLISTLDLSGLKQIY